MPAAALVTCGALGWSHRHRISHALSSFAGSVSAGAGAVAGSVTSIARPVLLLTGLGPFRSLSSMPATPKKSSDAGSDSEIILNSQVPSRESQLARLRSGEEFDVLVIGGGVTGSGATLDAVTRGLSVAMVERYDFASGTSSRSTKLIHGGVRYLEKAFWHADREQFELVKDALRERKHLLWTAPHLTRALPIVVPLYDSYPLIFFTAPYYWAGVKAYDLVAGAKGALEPSYWMSRREVRERFPQLKSHGLKGACVYYDGQFNDSRMNVGIALTAAAHGAAVANYIELVSFVTDPKTGIVCGGRVRDTLSGDEWTVNAKYILNATGAFSDAVRHMTPDPTKPAASTNNSAAASAASSLPRAHMITPSTGTHVIVSSRYCPPDLGMIVPKTEDGRVLFMLPWEGSTLIGTTDDPCTPTPLPAPKEAEVDWILKETSKFLDTDIKRTDVDAAWTGIRPLARHTSTSESGTQAISRDHVVEVTAPRVVSIAGGKWTTYRKMAEDAVDRLLKEAAKEKQLLHARACRTEKIRMIGGGGWSMQLPSTIQRLDLPPDVSAHLAHNYGDKALVVAAIAASPNDRVTIPATAATAATAVTATDAGDGGLNCRLATGYPFIEAEVVYAVRYEYAVTAVDVLAHRTRLAFLNSDAAWTALPRVVQIMSQLNGWDAARRAIEIQRGIRFLNTMSRSLNAAHSLPAGTATATTTTASTASPTANDSALPYGSTRQALEIRPFVSTAHHLPLLAQRLRTAFGGSASPLVTSPSALDLLHRQFLAATNTNATASASAAAGARPIPRITTSDEISRVLDASNLANASAVKRRLTEQLHSPLSSWGGAAPGLEWEEFAFHVASTATAPPAAATPTATAANVKL